MIRMLLAAVALPLVAATAQPVSVILDTDLGDDIDDTWALAFMLGCPEIDLKLVVTASDNTDTKTRLVAKILENMGRTDVPLGQGRKTSDSTINQEAYVGDYQLDGYSGTVYQDGIAAMIRMIKESATPITLCVIGPQTNLKAALERDPSIADNARVVSMAGSVHIGYGGKTGRVPEWNVKKDAAAAQAVFAVPWEITMAPLDICGTLRVEGERYEQVRDAATKRAKVLIENYELWTNRKHYAENASSILFDTVAAYLVYDEKLCTIETLKLTVDDAGNTVPDENGRPVRCAMQFTDRDAFEALLVNRISRDPLRRSKP